MLLDDTIIEVSWDGEIIWEWVCSEHFEEMGFDKAARRALARNPNMRINGGDWMHMNAMSRVGPNRWYDQGDERFHPDNIIWDGRQTNIIAIISRKTGKIVWQLGPDYNASPALKKLGWIIGQHHAHIIPKGLPGEGNLLVFDNGGWAGYGAPNPGAPAGVGNAQRDYSRVVELNPLTLELVWQYPFLNFEDGETLQHLVLYSAFVSSAQRLPNGNTLITEGENGHFIEITPRHEVVWDYVNPYFSKQMMTNWVYRAYRVPYEWVPQAEKPRGRAIPRLDNSKFRVPGSPRNKPRKVTTLRKRRRGGTAATQFCAVRPAKE
jgi:hypothetical protein